MLFYANNETPSKETIVCKQQMDMSVFKEWLRKYPLSMVLATIIFSLAIWIGIGFDLHFEKIWSPSLTLLFALPIFVFGGCYLLHIAFSDNSQKIRIKKRYIILPGFFMGLATLIGQSFSLVGTWDLIFSSEISQCLKAFCLLFAYCACYTCGITILFYLPDLIKNWNLPTIRIKRKLLNKYSSSLCTSPVKTAFITMSIILTPCVLISYPAIFMGDTAWQISQAMTGIRIMDQHPYFHTCIIKFSIFLGQKIFRSENVGMFIYTLIQVLCVITAISYTIKIVSKKSKRPVFMLILTFAFFIFTPFLHESYCVVTKDIIYAGVFTFAIYYLYKNFCENDISRMRDVAYLMLCIIMLCMLRNEGKYLICATLLLFLFIDKSRRILAGCLLIFTFIFNLAYFQGIYPALGVKSTGIKEMLSIPFQQTARYISMHPSEVTNEEKKAINAILDFDNLTNLYAPKDSNILKDSYKYDAGREDIINYFKVWTKMFFKHPGTYIQATIHNYYEYFDPTSGSFVISLSYGPSRLHMLATNDLVFSDSDNCIKTNFHQPAPLIPVASAYKNFIDCFEAIFPFSLFSIPAFYTWSLIIALCYAMARSNINAIKTIALPLFVLITCQFAPPNGRYGRIMFSVILSTPMWMVLYYDAFKNQKVKNI